MKKSAVLTITAIFCVSCYLFFASTSFAGMKGMRDAFPEVVSFSDPSEVVFELVRTEKTILLRTKIETFLRTSNDPRSARTVAQMRMRLELLKIVEGAKKNPPAISNESSSFDGFVKGSSVEVKDGYAIMNLDGVTVDGKNILPLAEKFFTLGLIGQDVRPDPNLPSINGLIGQSVR